MKNIIFPKLALIAAAVTLGQTSQATEFSAAFIGSSAYNSNVYGVDGDEESDMLLEAGAELELRSDSERRLDYLLNYRGDYQSYADADEANAMEHRQRFRLRYDIDPITQIILNQRYRDVSNLQFDLDDFDSGDTGIDISQNRYERNDISVELTRELSRRWSVGGSLGYQTIDFKRNINRSDSNTTEVGAVLNYLLSEKQDIGVGVRYANQDFDGADNRISAESDYFTLALLWTYRLDEFSSLVIEGGPTWVDTKQDRPSQTVTNTNVGGSDGGNLLRANFNACGVGGGQGQPIASLCDFSDPNAPPIPASDLGPRESYALDFTGFDTSDDDVTFFGSVVYTRRVSDWELEASYTRRQTATAGESLASSLDQFALGADYLPAGERWQLYARLTLDRRDAITNALIIDYTVVEDVDGSALRDVAFISDAGDNIDRDVLTGLIGGRYDVTRLLSAGLEFRYRDSERPASFAASGDAQSYEIEVSVRYEFFSDRL